MSKFNLKKLGVIAGISLSLAAGCGANDENENAGNSETSVSEEMKYSITGIEPGAGQTVLNEKVIEDYENLSGWKQSTSSTGAMLSSLDEAIKNKEPIMITAWSPHYMFAKWDLKFLEDPKGIFGEEEYAATIVRKDLKDELPNAYTILDRIHFEVSGHCQNHPC